MSGREHPERHFSDARQTGGESPKPRAPAQPVTSVPEVERAGESTERVSALAHEINNLLDGSLRWLSLARGTLAMVQGRAPESTLEKLQRQLDSATGGLEKMADLVHASMQGMHLPLGSSLLANCEPTNLGEAVRHAAQVVLPEAGALAVDVRVEVSDELAQLPSGALYTVVLNGLRNSLDSIREAIGQGAKGGHIDIAVREEPAPDAVGGDERAWVTIVIADDGIGPPHGADASRVFEHGFTTKEEGRGIGLALSRDIVRAMGGTIELCARIGADRRRPGAMLRVSFPAR